MLAILRYPRLTPHRRELALTRALEALGGRPAAESLRPLVSRALEANTKALTTHGAWQNPTRRNLHAPAAMKLDRQLARAVGGLVRSLKGIVRAFPAHTEAGAQAADVLDQVFPGGAGAITKLPFVEQADVVSHVLRLLGAQFAEAVEHLGLGLMVQNMADIHTKYVEVLSKPRLTFDQVREIDQRSYEAWLRVVAGVLGLAATGEPADVAAAAAVLKPLEDQRREYARYRKRRGTGRTSRPPEEPELEGEPSPGADGAPPSSGR